MLWVQFPQLQLYCQLGQQKCQLPKDTVSPSRLETLILFENKYPVFSFLSCLLLAPPGIPGKKL